MRRTGSPRRRPGARDGLARCTALALALLGSQALAALEFYQQVDRTKVGLEDTFRLTIVVSDAPAGASLQFPASDDFEVLSKSQSTQMSYQMGGGSLGSLKRVQKYVLVMRANRTGALVLPAALLITEGRTFRTEPITLSVERGRVADPRGPRPRGTDPFQAFPFPGFGFPDDLDDTELPQVDIPRSDSDLFLRAAVDDTQVYVGEQVTLSLFLFSRVDVSTVNTTMPKVDGFWSEDIEAPTQLAGEQRLVNGIPYRAFLLKRVALFPVKSGKLTIGAAEADVTTGFLFAGHKVRRKSEPVAVQVAALPAGAPAGFDKGNVGHWGLTVEASATQIELGQPVTLRVIAEGRGNVRSLALPKLEVPPQLKAYEPTTTDKVVTSKGKVGGRRVQEYVVTAQQTGSFEIPGVTLWYFDPARARYEAARTDGIHLSVVPGTAAPVTAAPGAEPAANKNVLAANGLRPLKHQAQLTAPPPPPWRRATFVGALLFSPGAYLALGLLGWVRGRLASEDEHAKKRKRTRAARARLAAAFKLKEGGEGAKFYGEVEKALVGFLEAKLGEPVGGLTREALATRLAAQGIPPESAQAFLSALEGCEAGRYAPGEGGAVRDQVLDQAAAAIEGWKGQR